ncbi:MULTISPECIES: DUF1349 domain-containing protein [Pseudomonas]|uniref:DUF1349 domain-containing protein n=1 Tax=Pseudomonas TaxID=286 RepID=UPI000DAF3F09|nr:MULTISPECIES: DUF1349 domain-containing protein [Pseudomonas]MCA5973420.1 DUF1349 domain-containing protein [Pseudomonas sp. P135]MCH5536305.1 DUF1349 domain-containing protein [Pseudomonas syringae pv. syringae]MCH5572874.1 DUF1349 domain-containing protein [Pseudomonas syringae pv. syringae]
MFDKGFWLNPPRHCSVTDERLTVTTDPQTDFWQQTHYGFCRDTGHFLGVSVTGDFTAQVHVQGDFKTLYDQAGLMVRIDERNWVKTGVEVSDGTLMLGSVLTCGQSDWATGVFDSSSGLWLRVTVAKGLLRIQHSSDGLRWPLLRLAPFPASDVYAVGPMCCSPERGGLEVVFSHFEVMPALGKDLHDLT